MFWLLLLSTLVSQSRSSISSQTQVAKKALATMIESARGVALSSHAVAGVQVALLAGFDVRSRLRVKEAERLLGQAEALCRCAMAVLSSLSPAAGSASGLGATAPRAVALATVSENAVTTDVSSAVSAPKRKRKKNKKKKKESPVDEAMPPRSAAAGDAAVSHGAAPPLAQDFVSAAVGGRSLAKKCSRERSPRRPDAAPSSGDSSSSSTSRAYQDGQAVVAHSLSRSELNGQIGTIVGFDAPSGRYLVKLASGSAPVKLKDVNLRLSIFAHSSVPT